MHEKTVKPNFLIIGAQKCGTTWLWEMLKQHPGTDLRVAKEIFFFSDSRIYRNGTNWYHSQFSHLDPSKVIGEASTGYFCDNVLINNIIPDPSLPTIPELITNELPKVKIFLLLRDPVKRAISAYYHHMQYNQYSPLLGLREAAERHPELRIIELGYYARYLKLWKKFVPPERMRCFIYEEDVMKLQEETIKEAYRFLNLAEGFRPVKIKKKVNKRMSWTFILLNYMTRYAAVLNMLLNSKLSCAFLNWLPLVSRPKIKGEDIEFLRSTYLPEKGDLEKLVGRSLDCWDYTQ